MAGRNALLVAGGSGSGSGSGFFAELSRPDVYNYGGDGGTPNGGNGTGPNAGGGATQTGVGSSAGGAASNNVGGVGGGSYGGSGGGGYYGGGSGGQSGNVGSGGSSWIAAGSTDTYRTAYAYDGSMTITHVIAATPNLTPPVNGSTVANTTPTYSGTAAAGSTVRLYVDGGSTALTTTASSGGTFSVAQPTALGQGSHSVYATAQSSGLPVSAGSAPVTFTVDTVAPTATLSTTAGNPTATSPLPFTVTFSEPVTGFGVGGLVVSNGTVTGSTVNGASGGTTYTFTITPASSSVVTVRVAAGAAQDAATNASLASNTVSVTYNSPPPGADIVNTGTLLTVQAGGILSVGTGGLGNQGGTLTNGGTLFVAGPLANPATLPLGAGTLEVRGDFTNGGTITPGTSAVTFSGAADQLLTAGGATLYRVVVNKATAGSNTLRLAGALTVSTQLTLTAGLVNTKNGSTVSTLRLPAGATLAGEATGRYVLGSLEITRGAVSGAAVDFGHGAVLNPTTNNLGTVAITRTAGLLTDDVSRGVNFANTAYKGIDRVYTVVPATPPSAAVQLTLSWLPDNDNGLTDFTQARGWQQTAAGQPWAGRGPVANASSRSISMSPTTLNRFTVSNGASPLPVTLLDFTAQAEGPAAVRLRWATASELNNAGFTVERSADGTAFTTIGTVAGAGTSATRHDYTLLDTNPPIHQPTLYYRLRQTDQDGTVAYSPIRTVQLTSSPAHQFTVFPTHVAAGQNASYRYTGPAPLPSSTCWGRCWAPWPSTAAPPDRCRWRASPRGYTCCATPARPGASLPTWWWSSPPPFAFSILTAPCLRSFL